MNHEDQGSLQAAVFRNTAADPAWVGYWLARHQQTEDLADSQLSAKLGIAMDKLVLLCLCRSPRTDHFAEDLRVICQRIGVSEPLLAGILRQEQTLSGWKKKAPPRDQGWLAAASDRPEDLGDPPSKPEERDDQ